MIRPGEFVILYHSDRVHYLIPVAEKGKFSTHKGNIDYADIQAADYGAALRTHLGTTFFLLKPNWSDLTKKVRRMTTIVYPKDAGLMLLKTGIGPGAKVVEVGTGSGGLTVLLANFVQPSGRVFTYEAREEFSRNARENLVRLGLEQFVEFHVRNVETDGFTVTDADAVFLDLAEPWTVLTHAHDALKGGHFLVAINPTIDQVLRTKAALELEGFIRIEVVEILRRKLLVRTGRTRPEERMISHTGYLIFAQKVNQKGAIHGLESSSR